MPTIARRLIPCAVILATTCLVGVRAFLLAGQRSISRRWLLRLGVTATEELSKNRALHGADCTRTGRNRAWIQTRYVTQSLSSSFTLLLAALYSSVKKAGDVGAKQFMAQNQEDWRGALYRVRGITPLQIHRLSASTSTRHDRLLYSALQQAYFLVLCIVPCYLGLAM